MPPFQLVPFTPDPLVAGLVLWGTVDRAGSTLRATYTLSGDRSALVVPTPGSAPTRRDGLWRATCFELFVAPRGQASYLEVNLAPSGDWNAYSFTSYREAMAPLAGVRFLMQRTVPDRDVLELGFALELGADYPLAALLDVAVTAVLEHTSGARSYWALMHAGERPDFHLRDSFILQDPARAASPGDAAAS